MDVIHEFFKSYSSLIISICAISLTMQQGWATRKHNRLSVRPRLATYLTSVRLPDQADVVVHKAILLNSGLGPAIIKTYELLIDGSPIVASDPIHIYEAMNQATTVELIPEICMFGILRNEHVMAKDAEHLIATVAYKVRQPSDIEEIKRFHIRVRYKSAYEELFIYDSREHLK